MKGFSWNKLIFVLYIASMIYFITALFFTHDPIKMWIGLGVSISTYIYLTIVVWRRRKFKPERYIGLVKFDEKWVIHQRDNGKKDQMEWEDIHRISVCTLEGLDEEPREMWLRLHSLPWRRVITLYSKTEGFQSILDHVMGFGHFNHKLTTEALTSRKAMNETVWMRYDNED